MEQPRPDEPEQEIPDAGQGDEQTDQGEAPTDPAPSGGTYPPVEG